jgi:hypothetical protein
MDPDPIVAGALVKIRLCATPADGESLYAYVVSLHGSPEHRTYVLYLTQMQNFIEMSRDAGYIYYRLNTYLWGWMRAYVEALEKGSKKLQGEVEDVLRNIEDTDHHAPRFGTEKPITEITSAGDDTLLHIAAKCGKYHAAQILLKRPNIHVNQLNEDHETALWHACDDSRVMCKLLLEHRADPNVGKRHIGFRGDDASKILMLYGADKERVDISRAVEWPRVASVLVHALCSSAPISKLPVDVLRTYLLPLLV